MMISCEDSSTNPKLSKWGYSNVSAMMMTFSDDIDTPVNSPVPHVEDPEPLPAHPWAQPAAEAGPIGSVGQGSTEVVVGGVSETVVSSGVPTSVEKDGEPVVSSEGHLLLRPRAVRAGTPEIVPVALTMHRSHADVERMLDHLTENMEHPQPLVLAPERRSFPLFGRSTVTRLRTRSMLWFANMRRRFTDLDSLAFMCGVETWKALQLHLPP